MKTAMQELIESFNINKDLDPYVLSMLLRGKMQELIEKEKQQIIDAAEHDWEGSSGYGEGYYNKTYGK